MLLAGSRRVLAPHSKHLLLSLGCIRSSHRTTGSDKLFADAEREESGQGANSSQRPSRLQFLEDQNENWDGDEPIKHAVLRMLVDKHKPLRMGTIQSADQKLKANVLTVATPAVRDDGFLKPVSGSWATETLIPAIEGHQPWHTVFKAPSHTQASVKLAAFPPNVNGKRSKESIGKKEKELLKCTETAMRLDRARESTLDYRMGIRKPTLPSRTNVAARGNPVSMRGWGGLVEDRIEKARAAGYFNVIKGRGKPIKQFVEEANPFIDREEFLMNRIVRRNGAVPPWVELQRELDTAVDTMRSMLRQAWIRRAVRTLSSAFTSTPTQADIALFRDARWLAEQRSFHDAAIAEVNSLVRKYNGMAPYIVRRPYHDRETEIRRLYEECAEEVFVQVSKGKQVGPRPVHPEGQPGSSPALWMWIWEWMKKVLKIS